MNKLDKQQENINTLLQLVSENPELEIVPMVATECVSNDEFGYCMAEWGTASIDKYWCSDERIYFKSDDFGDLVEELMESYDEGSPTSEEEIEKWAEEKVNSYEWIKAIVVHIDEQ